MGVIGSIGGIGAIGRVGNASNRRNIVSSLTPDFVIASNSDWISIPTSLWSNGGLIEVQPGTYTPSTANSGTNIFLNRHPSSPLIFKGTFPATTGIGSNWERSNSANSKSRINDILIDNCTNIRFEDLEIVTTRWNDSDFDGAITFSNSCTNIEFNRVWVHTGYRGNPDVLFDPLKTDYPEYASIQPRYSTSTGALISLTPTYRNVGDLIPDGVYTLTFAIGDPITYTTVPQATMTVVGSQISTCTIITPGASTNSASYNDSTGILAKQITWAGQQRFGSYIKQGARTRSNTRTYGTIAFRECLFTDLGAGIKGDFNPTKGQGSLTVTGCTFDRIYSDYFSLGIDERPQAPLTFSWNYGTRPFSVSGHPGDPHSDWFQIYMTRTGISKTVIDTEDMVLEGNIFNVGNSLGDVQGLFISDVPTDNTASFQIRLVGNAVLGRGTGNGIAVDRIKYSYVAHNSAFSSRPAETGTNAVQIKIGTVSSQNLIDQGGVVFNNIANTFGFGPYPSVETPNWGSNLVSSKTTSSLANTFVGGNGPIPNSLDESLAYLSPRPAAIGKGSIIPDYINYSTRTINRQIERPYVNLIPQLSVPLNSTTNTGWRRVLGGPPSIAVTVTNGYFEVSDTITGTNAVLNPPTVNSGQFIRVTTTSTSTGGTITSAGIRLNGYPYSFDVSTVPSVQYPRVSNQGTAWSRMSAGYAAGYTPTTHDTAAQKFIFSWRVRDKPQTVSNSAIFGVNANTRIGYSGTGAGVTDNSVVVGGTGNVFLRVNTNVASSTGSFVHHLVVIDVTAGTPDLQSRWWINGIPQTDFSSRVVNTAFSLNVGTSGNGWVTAGTGLFNTLAATAQSNADLEFMWVRWGNSSLVLPEFTPFDINQFLPDNMAADGTVLGIQPQIFLKGTLGEYNSTLTNSAAVGTALAGKVFTIQTGTYITAP